MTCSRAPRERRRLGPAPLAPWALAGESIVGLARWQGAPPVFPVGLTRMPGPALVAATRYTDSPVGAFVELIIGHPARLGLRFGWMISESVVTAEDAWIGGRLNWGFPSERADLRWEVDGHARALVWPSRGFSIRGEPKGMPLPWLVPVRALQRRSDGCMIVPGHQRGKGAVRPHRDRGEARRWARRDRGFASRRDGVRTTRHGAPRAGAAGPAQVARRPSEGARACGMV